MDSRDCVVVHCRYNINKENIPSRAYIAFKSAEQLAEFSQAYDGHLFRDKSGSFRENDTTFQGVIRLTNFRRS